QVVIAGVAEPVRRLGEQLAAQGYRTQELLVSHAFHSPLMEPMLAGFEAVAGAIEHAPPRLGWISNLTGELLEWSEWGARMGRYWREHVRAPVCFEQGIRAAAA